jgi:hypothetical protein
MGRDPSGGKTDMSGPLPPNGEKLAKADSPHPVGGGSKKPTFRSPVVFTIGRRPRNSKQFVRIGTRTP